MVSTLFEYGNFYFNVVVIVMALLLAGKFTLFAAPCAFIDKTAS